MSSIGVRVKALREAMGLSQAELARRIKIKQPSLWLIEEGRTKTLRGKTLANLCVELRTTQGYLLEDRPEVEDVDLPAMEAELLFTIRNLQPDRRLALMEYARFLMKQQPSGPTLLKQAGRVHQIKAQKTGKSAARKHR